MLGLAIALYVVAALFIFLAFRPALVFYVREGWKFRERLRPSGLYSGASTASCLIAGLAAAVVGTVALAAAVTRDPKADAQRHCTDVVQPAFARSIEWDDGHVANPDVLADLARVHGVEVKIDHRPDALGSGYDVVGVYDPTHHFPPDQAVFAFSGNPVIGPDHVDSPCDY